MVKEDKEKVSLFAEHCSSVLYTDHEKEEKFEELKLTFMSY